MKDAIYTFCPVHFGDCGYVQVPMSPWGSRGKSYASCSHFVLARYLICRASERWFTDISLMSCRESGGWLTLWVRGFCHNLVQRIVDNLGLGQKLQITLPGWFPLQ